MTPQITPDILRCRLAGLLSASLIVVLLLLIPGSVQAQGSTIFMAPRVTSESDAPELAAIADETLAEIALNQNQFFLDRSLIPDLTGPGSSWPPSTESLKELKLPASVNYLATFTLTRFAQQISVDAAFYKTDGNDAPRYFTAQAQGVSQLPAALTTISDEILALSEPGNLIGSIHIEGQDKTSAGAILRRISSKAGQRLNPEKLSDDIRQIYAMGYFDDVQVRVEDEPQGSKVIFVVTEKPVISQVLISGSDKIKEKDIREAISVVPGTIVNTRLVHEAEESISRLYKEKGFHDAVVSSEIIDTSQGRINVRFNIEEGKQVYIHKIEFTGNHSFKPRALRKAINTRTKGIFSWFTRSGRLQPEEVAQDRERLAAYYHNHGFIDAMVGEPEITKDGKRLTVTFNIEEGERYKVGEIELAGEFIVESSELMANLKLPEESWFSRDILRRDIIWLSDRYAQEGFAFADITPKVSRDDAAKEMNVLLELKKNSLVHINRIVIQGNTRTRDNVIRREITVEEGGIFDTSALRSSMERLQQLQYFEKVDINPEPALQRDDLMDVKVEVEEKPTGTFSIGAGYSSVDSLMFMGEVRQDNFMGRGQRLSLQGDLSSTATHYNLSFTDPRLDDSNLLLGFDLYNWEREYTDYTKASTGGAIRFGYKFWDKWNAYWGYGYEHNELSDILPGASRLITDSMHLKVNSYVRLGVTRDTRNNRLDPTKGSYQDIGIKHGGGWLGGDTAYSRLELSSTWFFPWEDIPMLKDTRSVWLNDTTFRFKGAMGYIRENESGRLPIYEKFFLGGLRTMRGFETATVSPRDPDPSNNDRIGGDRMWYINSEWIFPLVKDIGLKGLIFFDAGNAYSSDQGWSLDEIKSSVGLGFRWLSPMGPLRLEWGFNLDPEEDEDNSVWDFSIGGFF